MVVNATFSNIPALLPHGRWISVGSPASSTTKTVRHDIAGILLKVALTTINQIKNIFKLLMPCELLPSLFVCPSAFHILIFSSETTGPIATKLWWNGPWVAPFQMCQVIPTSCGGHLGPGSEMPDIILVGDHPRIISAKFG
jgi:hypothetical protein